VIKVHTTKYTEIDLPKYMSTELAELVGIHFGDGGIHIRKRKTYVVTYCFNKKEIQLREDLKTLFKKLFNIEIKQYLRNNVVESYCGSKMLAYFLNQNFGAPLGKKDSLKIPTIIKEEKEDLCAFLRGLYRTDGCLFIKKYGKYKYPVIKITTKCKEFAEELTQSLIDLGFRARINVKWGRNYFGYDVVLHGEKQLIKWNNEILKIKNGDAGI